MILKHAHEITTEELGELPKKLNELVEEYAASNRPLAFVLTDLMEAICQERLSRAVHDEALALKLYRNWHGH
ncbi:MAG: hypothetical protein KGZ93_09375 [Actinobacteria bacterium]|nr:hypothetical protein [Actinomycetota bacterium]